MMLKLTLSKIPVGKCDMVLKLMTELRRMKAILCLILTFQQCGLISNLRQYTWQQKLF